jgi:hypothetical protein
MHSLLKTLDSAEMVDKGRRPIRLEGPCPQAGIAAALRRAFDNPVRPADDVEDEFALLLSQVH